ncbi:MAG: J domain-containing protein [Rhodocyclales bacterium]|nr:J domain-containing protein [Rhodocyclales bacterium]
MLLATDPARDADDWYARVAGQDPPLMPFEAELPARPMASLAAFVARVLAEERELLLLVPGDEFLPELSSALDLALRPLCLILPQAEFATGLALRATLLLLKSRLWRDGDDSRGAAWMAQRQRLETNAELWQTAQAWLSSAESSQSIPPTFAGLFPVLAMPVASWQTLPLRRNAILLLYRCDAPAELDGAGLRMLRIGTLPAATPAQVSACGDETTRLLLERSRLSQDIADLELELASVQGELADFMRDYYRRVAPFMAEHDLLQAGIAARQAAAEPGNSTLDAEAEQQRRQAEESAADADRFSTASPADAPPFDPDRETRQEFRRLAQQIHPDRALDEDDRAWRTQLMSEANRAYRSGDHAGLREIAALWEEQAGVRSGVATPGRSQLESQLSRLRARLARIERELHRLFGSQLYTLFIAARQARRQGRDLLAEMTEQLAAKIAELRRVANPD